MRKVVVFLFAQLLSLQLTACHDDEIWIKPDDISEEVTEYMAIIGDIQHYTNGTYFGLFQQSLNWISQ